MSRGATRQALGTIGSGIRELTRVRWVRIVLVLLLLAGGVRLGLESILAFTLNRVAGQRDLVCSWSDLDISILGGRGELKSFEIRAKAENEGEESERLLGIDYGLFDLSILSLLRGKIRVSRAELDGFDSYWIRGRDGRWNVENHVAAAEVLSLLQGSEEEEEPEEPEEEKPINLAPPLAIDALRLQDARYHIIDHALEPPLEAVFEIHAQLSHLDAPERAARFSATVTGGDFLDGAHVTGEADWGEGSLDLNVNAQFGGLRPSEFAPYLAALDIRPACHTLEGRLSVGIELSVVGEAADALSMRTELRDIRLVADGAEELALDQFVLDVETLSSERTSVPSIEITGARGAAALEGHGALRLAGFELLGTRSRPAASQAAPKAPTNPLAGLGELLRLRDLPRWVSLFALPDAEAYPWRIGALKLSESLLAFSDRTVEPAADLLLRLESVEIGAVVHDPNVEANAIPIDAQLTAPGLAESITVKGEIGPFAPKRHIDLAVDVEGIGLEELEGHLRRAGLERALTRGSFGVRLSGEASSDETGRTEGWLRFDQALMKEGGDLLGVRGIAATELLLDPAVPLLRLGDVEISGTRMTLGRDAEQRFFAFGLRTLGFSPAASVPSASEAEAPVPQVAESEPDESGSDSEPEVAQETPATEDEPQPEPVPPARLELGRLAWTDSHIEFVDEFADPPQTFVLDELGFELTNLTLGGDPEGPLPDPARIVAHLRADELVDDLTLEGTVQTRPGDLDVTFDLQLRGDGLRGKLAAPYLAPLGVEPVLEDGQLALDITGSLGADASGLGGDLALRKGSLVDGGTTLLAVEECAVDGFSLGGEEIRVAAIKMTSPLARVTRDTEGNVNAAGWRTVPVDKAPALPPDPTDEPPPGPELTLPQLPPIRIDELALEDARLSWADDTFEPVFGTELRVGANIEQLTTDGAPANFEARLEIGDILDELAAQGTIELGPEAFRIRADVSGGGLRAGPLAAMLPPGITLESADARLAVSVEAAIEQAEAGLAARLEARDFSWGPRDEMPWLAFANATLAAPRLDPAAGVIEIGPISLDGLVAEAHRDEQGVVHAFGVRIGSPPAEPAPAPEPAAEEGADDPLASAGGGTAPSAPPPPRVVLVDDAALRVERFLFRDDTLGPDARPVEGTLEMRLRGGCVLVEEHPEDLPPFEWSVSGSLAGLVADWQLAGQVAPFAVEPRIEASFEARGVRTAGVVEVVPALAETLAGELEEGHAAGEFDATFFVQRARPTDLGLSRPFGAEFKASQLAYRDVEGGVVLAGIDEIAADVKRIDTGRGFVHVETLELVNPQGRLVRGLTSVQAAGLALLLGAQPVPQQVAGGGASSTGSSGGGADPWIDAPVATGEPTDPGDPIDQADPIQPEQPESEDAELARQEPRSQDAGEDPWLAPGAGERVIPTVRVEESAPTSGEASGDEAEPVVRAASLDQSDDAGVKKKSGSGGEFRIDLMTVSGIDVVLRDETTEPPLVVELNGLDVEVKRFTTRALTEKRPVHFSAYLEAGSEDGVPVFEDVAASGRVSLYPAPAGWTQFSMSGLELPAFTGLAEAQGIAIENGALDASARVRLKGEDGMSVDSSIVFTDLDVAEPENGPIQSVLSLPMTLDAALFLLRNQHGEHRFSTGFKVGSEGLSGTQMGLAATRAFAEVMARALAAVPLRLLNSLFGGGEEEEDEPTRTFTLTFAPGASELDGGAAAVLEEVRAQLEDDRDLVAVLRHELTSSDLAQAERLANPSPEACMEIIAGLRQRKAYLWRERDELATQVRALFAVRARAATRKSTELRDVERELAAVEDSLDEMFEIVRSDAPRRRMKRTRSTCREIGELRLESAADVLRRNLRGDGRVDVRRARFDAIDSQEGGRVLVEIHERPPD